MMKLSDEQKAENRDYNERKSGIWAKVNEHAQWSRIAQSMMYEHAQGTRWTGARIAAYKSFYDAVRKRRREMAERGRVSQ